jgi:nitroimidazol reductase NimA-like FMN-containing flavoprotein (pyridoxamine 5'-phosphate oxidase superfamily)
VIIQKMMQQEIKDLLERASIGRSACTKDNQPCVVPVRFAYHAVYLYSFTTVGQKIEWMRRTRKSAWSSMK